MEGVLKMKKLFLHLTKFIYFFSCWWIIFSINACAYIDPSVVTYVIQAVAGVFVAFGAILTVFRHKIFSFFNKTSSKHAKREIHIKNEEDIHIAIDKQEGTENGHSNDR